MSSAWLRFRQRLEENGQLDWLVDLPEARAASVAFSVFEQAVLDQTGLSFDEWALMRLRAGDSIRTMAAILPDTYPATLWRWIKRRLPREKLAAAERREPLPPGIISRVSRLLERGLRPSEIMARTGLSRSVVERVRRRWSEKRISQRIENEKRELNQVVRSQRNAVCMPWVSSQKMKQRQSA